MSEKTPPPQKTRRTGLPKDIKIAIVCDWLTTRGGAEEVVSTLHEMFPTAPIYTSLYTREHFPELTTAKVVPSFLQNIPFASRYHKIFLPWMPLAFEQFDLSAYDIVISSSHSCAKGVITRPGTLHICYCHTPMRYAWDGNREYLARSHIPKFLQQTIIANLLTNIRIWDRLSADRVDSFIANSGYIGRRIAKYYRQESDVVYPPVSLKAFTISGEKKEYFLAVGRLTAYKRFDLLVETFNANGLPLIIVGDGPEMKKLRAMAKDNVVFLGRISNEERAKIYSEARCLLFPQCEDFGIVVLEASASGTPVIAYGRGGACETVIDGVTGLFFDEQSVASLQTAIERFDTMQFDRSVLRAHAEKFDVMHFEDNFLSLLGKKYAEWVKKSPSR